MESQVGLQARSVVYVCSNMRSAYKARQLRPPPMTVILRGLSGSGKTTFARALDTFATNSGLSIVRCSADDSFVDDSGRYVFRASKLSEAHEECFEKFVDSLQREIDVVVVDNTNVCESEYRRYQERSRHWLMVTISCDSWEEAQLQRARSVHDVPEETVARRYRLFTQANESLREAFDKAMADSPQIWIDQQHP